MKVAPAPIKLVVVKLVMVEFPIKAAVAAKFPMVEFPMTATGTFKLLPKSRFLKKALALGSLVLAP